MSDGFQFDRQIDIAEEKEIVAGLNGVFMELLFEPVICGARKGETLIGGPMQRILKCKIGKNALEQLLFRDMHGDFKQTKTIEEINRSRGTTGAAVKGIKDRVVNQGKNVISEKACPALLYGALNGLGGVIIMILKEIHLRIGLFYSA